MLGEYTVKTTLTDRLVESEPNFSIIEIVLRQVLTIGFTIYQSSFRLAKRLENKEPEEKQRDKMVRLMTMPTELNAGNESAFYASSSYGADM